MKAVLAAVGHDILGRATVAGRAVLMLWHTVGTLPQVHRCWRSLIRQLDMAGFGSIVVLSLIAGLTGMIMAVQTGSELQRFGVLENLGAIIGATFCREMGPIWAAVIILARVGGAMAAELGTMAVNEEIDALRLMSINPLRYLVLPRLLALVIAMPLLTAIADGVGLLGGALVTKAQFGQPMSVFFDSAQSLLGGLDFWSGLAKATVFALIIGTIACDQGMATSNGAEGVGKATTTTVVLSVIFVLLSDFGLTAVILRVVKPIVDSL